MTGIVKEIGDFVNEHIDGCKFVGLSNENEVFIEFAKDSPDREDAAATAIRTRFPDIEKVTVVVRPSIEEVKEMVEGLNAYLEETPKKKKDLLDIGDF